MMSNWVLLAALAASPAQKTANREPPKPPAVEVEPAVAAPDDAHAAAPEAEPVADDPDLPKVGQPYLSFRLRALNPDLQGQFIGIDSVAGSDRDDDKSKLVVLSFMASYCKPCKKEMPYLQKLYAKYKDQGLRVMMVSVDTTDEGHAEVARLVAANGVTFPVLKDIGGLASRRYLGQRTPLPSLFMINAADGNIISVNRGYNEQASERLLQDVQKALGQPAEALK